MIACLGLALVACPFGGAFRSSLLVLLVCACNPYDAMPRARCQTAAFDCRAGEACRSGYCWGDRSLVLRIANGPMHTALIATPTGGDPRHTDDARLLGFATTDGRVVWQDLPRLRSWVLVWDGAEGEVCAGDAFALVRAPEVHEGRLSLRASHMWEGDCFALPTSLGYQDRAFARSIRDT